MKRLKLIFTLTLTFLLISTLAQASVFETINGLKYSLDTLKNEASLVANSPGYSGDIVVPEKITSGGKDYPVISLGDRCFYDCYKLTSINIPSSVTSLGDSCFNFCIKLTSITIPSSVISLGNFCFFDCPRLTSITIPSSVTSIGDYCFFNCSGLTSITIPSSVTSLGEECFANCLSFTSITIPSSVKSLGKYCFFNCSRLRSIAIPSSVTSLEDGCFFGCSGLTSIEIPLSVTSLGNSCFESCWELTTISIPSTVTLLGGRCFSDCSKLTSISCYAIMPPKCVQEIFNEYDPSFCKLYVPQESIDKYKVADGWKSFPNIYALGGSGESDQINSTSTRGIVATCNNGIITISGLKAHENVTFYSLNGKQLGSATAVDGTATFAVNASNDIVIAKFGGLSMKIVTK